MSEQRYLTPQHAQFILGSGGVAGLQRFARGRVDAKNRGLTYALLKSSQSVPDNSAMPRRLQNGFRLVKVAVHNAIQELNFAKYFCRKI